MDKRYGLGHEVRLIGTRGQLPRPNGTWGQLPCPNKLGARWRIYPILVLKALHFFKKRCSVFTCIFAEHMNLNIRQIVSEKRWHRYEVILHVYLFSLRLVMFPWTSLPNRRNG